MAAAGFSVGEYSALVFAGALSFEDGMYVTLRQVLEYYVMVQSHCLK